MVDYINSIEEVDTALFNAISGFSIDGKPVEVTYYTPDIDLQKLNTPAIVLYRTNPFRDLKRWSNDGEIRDNPIYDINNNLISIARRLHPEAWSVMYTVKTVYDYQTDGVKLNDFLLRLFFRDSYITIKGVNYTIDQLSAGLWGSQYKDFGRVEDGKRRFQETYSYRIDIWLEIGERKTFKTTQEVIVKQNQL